MQFSNAATYNTYIHITDNPYFLNSIHTVAKDLLSQYDNDTSIKLLAESIYNICEYDINESLKESSSLTKSLVLISLKQVNFDELAFQFINKLT